MRAGGGSPAARAATARCASAAATSSSTSSNVGISKRAVVARVGRAQLRQPLARAQCLQFREREVLGEPAGDRFAVDVFVRLARGELRMRGDVGGAADLVLVTRHERPVPGDHQIGFDVVRTLLNRDEVARKRVLGHVAARPAVRYDKWPRSRRHRGCRHENCAREPDSEPVTESAPGRCRSSHCLGGSSPWIPKSAVAGSLTRWDWRWSSWWQGARVDSRPTVVGQPPGAARLE